MTFWHIFFRVLPWRPGAALAAAWYHVTRRRVRARNRLRVAGGPLPFAYDLWMRNVERADAVAEQAAASSRSESEPRFTVIIDNRAGDDIALAQTQRSIQDQSLLAGHEIKLLGDGSGESETFDDAIRSAAGDLIIVLHAGHRLARNAFFHVSEAACTDDAEIFFGDEDCIDLQGRRSSPWFKPAWNRELFLAVDYVTAACAIRTQTALRSLEALQSGERSMPALVLQSANAGARITHVPHVLVHRNDSRQPSSPDHARAVASFISQEGGRTCAGPFGTIRVSWPLPVTDWPLVSIIIPTRDKVELLRTCLETLLSRTAYTPFEVLVVDNGSEEPATKRYLEELAREPRARVLPAPGPYNYAALNNDAAKLAAGEYLLLLNNDTEVVTADWLEEMMRQAVRPDVGAVGAKLLYDDRTIQHAGVVIGIGDAAGHAHRNLPAEAPGYFFLPQATHYVSAVTGACLLVNKAKYLSVGGLDADSFAVAYNDVDLCLRLERAGWRNVYVPHATLIHHESKSRGKDHAPDQIERYRGELQRFQDRWDVANYKDPVFNPNLDRASETFVLRF